MKSKRFALRDVLAGVLAIGVICAVAESFTEGVRVDPSVTKLKAGEFVWEPERAPEGPVLVVVSKPEQVAYVYRNGVRIARSSVSTGRPGHDTPVGVFTVLEKEVKHTSTIYKGAEMPFMERLTWNGIAMHAGQLPGYPASHGCVRLPLEFSKLLYTVTTKGITVIIADDHTAPRETVHPGMIFGTPAAANPEEPTSSVPGATVSWTPEKSPTGPVTIIFSGPSANVYVYRNGIEIGRAPFTATVAPGQHVYSALDGMNADGRRKWIRVDGKPAEHDPSFTEIAQVSKVPASFIAGVKSVVQPGTTLILTDQPVDKSTQSDPDFKILGVGEVATR